MRTDINPELIHIDYGRVAEVHPVEMHVCDRNNPGNVPGLGQYVDLLRLMELIASRCHRESVAKIGVVTWNSSPGGASKASHEATTAAARELAPLCAWTAQGAAAVPTATIARTGRAASSLLRNDEIMGPRGERCMGANYSLPPRSSRVTLRDSQSLINYEDT